MPRPPDIKAKKSANRFRRVLVANRGEIAVRIIRAARECGLETVAIYSDVDAGALHTRLADTAIALKGNSARDTYLHQEKIITAARQSGADAIHPGYGFFAENARFAEAVKAAKICFVGPRPEVISLMGDKDAARKKAHSCGVPVVPGTELGESIDELKAFGKRARYPLIAKAIAGGSGRGMRVIESESELETKIQEAEAEALSAFGNKEVILEKLIEKPRHIEVQVFGDEHGNVVHFFERDCSVQRRHQKIIEEAPAANFHPNVREKLLEAATRLARAVSYSGAGTVEFLVADGHLETGTFYFLEMNTRIQVEHPVTEMITGIDLVKLQFEVAQGHKLPFSQSEISSRGHALEFRVYAEDSAKNFQPCTGTVLYMSRASGPGVREDGWAEAGTRVSSFYDSLLCKLIIFDESRDQAIARAKCALSDFVVDGPETTLSFHRWMIQQAAFLKAKVDVKWIEREYQGEKQCAKSYSPLRLPPTSSELHG